MGSDDRRQQMRRHLRRREREGLTYAELAAATGESRHTLAWWAWKLRQEEELPAAPAFVELEVAEELPAADSHIEVQLASGHRLVVRPGFDPETLARAVAALERGC